MSITKPRPTLTPVLLILLALLSSFTPLSIDMYLPALPVIAVDLHGTAGDIQLTLSAFMIAFGAGQIFYGPAGDRFGRRPVILGGLAIYVVTSIGCAFAIEAGHLVGLRFLQGLAACGGVVLARTMVRDLAEKDQAARAMSLMMACTSIAPMRAPLKTVAYDRDGWTRINSGATSPRLRSFLAIIEVLLYQFKKPINP